jgi:hypothetical protein
MAYTSFTSTDLEKKFGKSIKGKHLFAKQNIVEIAPSAWLIETIRRGRNLGLGSEKSRSERFVSPVLTELHNLSDESFGILSGVNLDVDASQGLNGEVDFLLSFNQVDDIVKTPIFSITEAKKNDVELGTIQCSAQLIAATMFNENDNHHFPHIYGCSTTGTEWRFIQLIGNDLYFDIDRYSIYELPKLLGVLKFIVDEAKNF